MRRQTKTDAFFESYVKIIPKTALNSHICSFLPVIASKYLRA